MNDAEHYHPKRDFESSIREFLDNLSNERVNSKGVVFAPDLLEKRLNKFKSSLMLNKFKSSLGTLASNEKPLFLWDCSNWFSGKHGLLITDHGIMTISNTDEGTHGSRITWSKIKSVVKENHYNWVSKKKQNDSFWIWINGRKFFNAHGKDKEKTFDLVFELLRTISGSSKKHQAADYEIIQTYTDENWEEIKVNEEPIMLIFPHKTEDGSDDFISESMGRDFYEGYRYGSRMKIAKVYHQASPMIVEKCGITQAPSIAIVCQGALLATVSGGEGAGLSGRAAEAMDRVLGTIEEKDGTVKLQAQALKDQKQASRNVIFTNWSNALVSGLVAGLVFLFARTKLEGAATLIIPGVAIAFFITNKNFGFSFAQRAFAIVLMLVIGTFGPDIIELLLSH